MIHSESVSLMVSFFLIVGITLPFAYSKFSLNHRKMASSFNDFIFQNHMKPTVIEKWKNHQLGFDSEQNKLLYFRNGHYPIQTVIDLKEIKDISIHEHSHSSGKGKYKHEVMDYLGVKLQYLDETHPPKMLEIYDGKLFPKISSERIIAKKWLNLLQNQIKSNQNN